LVTEEGLERDAVSKALMSVLRQDTKGIYHAGSFAPLSLGMNKAPL
jgi:hypothetical protein